MKAKEQAEFLESILKPGVELNELQTKLAPTLKRKLELINNSRKRLSEMLQETKTIQADMEAAQAVVIEIGSILWVDAQRIQEGDTGKDSKGKKEGNQKGEEKKIKRTKSGGEK